MGISQIEALRSLKGQVEWELKNNILAFWMEHTPDHKRGGFLGEIDAAMTTHPDADKSLVLNARILWTFATAYRFYQEERYLAMAERAFDYLNTYFLDKDHGGYYWMLDANGSPTQDKKQVYGQAFVIYAFSEYYRAAGKQEALDLAIELFRLLEKHGRDTVHQGYFEALGKDWTPTDDLSLSAKDLNVAKSMNTHLHVLEGYTNLLRVWKDDELKNTLSILLGTTLDHIVDSKAAHFILFFDADWTQRSHEVSYGHDTEGSWLLLEAAEVLGDETLLEKTRRIALAMAEAVYKEGVDPDGGILNEAGPEGLTDTAKDWWPQAEAVVGFYNAYQMSGDGKFADAALRSWAFIDSFIIDKTFGEWHWGVSREGVPRPGIMKVSAWKCPYHNSRACFEMIERLSGLVE